MNESNLIMLEYGYALSYEQIAETILDSPYGHVIVSEDVRLLIAIFCHTKGSEWMIQRNNMLPSDVDVTETFVAERDWFSIFFLGAWDVYPATETTLILKFERDGTTCYPVLEIRKKNYSYGDGHIVCMKLLRRERKNHTREDATIHGVYWGSFTIDGNTPLVGIKACDHSRYPAIKKIGYQGWVRCY